MADKDGSTNHVTGAFVGLIGFIVVVFCNSFTFLDGYFF